MCPSEKETRGAERLCSRASEAGRRLLVAIAVTGDIVLTKGRNAVSTVLGRRWDAVPCALLGPIEQGQAGRVWLSRLRVEFVEPCPEWPPWLASSWMRHCFPARLPPVLRFRHRSVLGLLAPSLSGGLLEATPALKYFSAFCPPRLSL
jgi:hypothetical protein